MFIDKKSPIPVYFQLKNIILEKIKNSEYFEEGLIPSERELSDLLGISRMTVRQALSQLVNEGVLYREKGKGTFVSKRKIIQNNITSFSELVKRRGLIPSTEILYFNKDVNNHEIKKILDMEINESLYNLKRLRLANLNPIGIEEVFLPEKFFTGIDKYDLTTSLYSIIRDKYSLTISYIDNTIQAKNPTKDEKNLLKITSNKPVINIAGTACSADGVKLFYQNDTYRADEYQYNARIFMNKDN